VGFGQLQHTYLLCPIRVSNQAVLIDSLYQAGFDAADRPTSLAVIFTKRHTKPMRAIAIMEKLVFVTIDHAHDQATFKCLVDVIRRHHETSISNPAII
jgi:hypothetical protein